MIDGGIIVAALSILAFLCGLVLFGIHITGNQNKDQIGQLRRDFIELKKILESRTFFLTSAEIKQFTETLKRLSKSGITLEIPAADEEIEVASKIQAAPPAPSPDKDFGEYYDPNCNVHFELIPKTDQNESFEKGNRQPITEILSEIYDNKKDKKNDGK